MSFSKVESVKDAKFSIIKIKPPILLIHTKVNENPSYVDTTYWAPI